MKNKHVFNGKTRNVVSSKKVMPFYSRMNAIRFALLMSLGAVYPVQADIVVDSSAAANMQPGVGQNNAGITQIDIQAPSAGGISHNKFKEFDVNSQGVILNNSRNDIQSALGGDVKANANLTSRTADIILNEVNSSNPSFINGFIEVAGSKAQVIIANPSGITCNGCGFINASGAVLTTGQAQFEGGKLSGILVEKGAVNIEGNGMFDGGSDYTDILARSVKINSMVNGANIRVVTGRNLVGAAGNITALENDSSVKPQVALDVTRLGGVNGSNIRLIGTEKGLGVNNDGWISADSITVTTEGEISNAGTLQANGDLDVSGSAFINKGEVSGAQVRINADQIINHNALIAAGDSLVINSLSFIDNQGGTISSRGTMNVKAGHIDNQQGTIFSSRDVTVEADSLNNEEGSLTSYNDLELSVADKQGLDGGNIWASKINWITKDRDETEPSPSEPEQGAGEEPPSEPEQGAGEESPSEPEQGAGEESPSEPEQGAGEESPSEPEQGAGEESPSEPEQGSADEGSADYRSDYSKWAEESGFNKLFSKLYHEGGYQFKLRWGATYLNDVMKFFYEAISSGQTITDEMIYQASSPGFLGSAGLENVKALAATAELMQKTWQDSNKS